MLFLPRQPLWLRRSLDGAGGVTRSEKVQEGREPRRCQEQGLKSRLHKTQVGSIHIIPYYIFRQNQSHRKYQYIYQVRISLKDVYTIYEYFGIEKNCKKTWLLKFGG